jgi:hypothetical protein
LRGPGRNLARALRSLVGACGQVTAEPVCEVDGEGYLAGESFSAPNSTCKGHNASGLAISEGQIELGLGVAAQRLALRL